MIVVLLAVTMTAGMGLSVVHASTMAAQMQMSGTNEAMAMSDMAMPDMAQQAPVKCPDCDLMGKVKGGGDCLVPGCTAAAAIMTEATAETVSLPLPVPYHPALSAFLHGHNTVPDPYPPRISDIG